MKYSLNQIVFYIHNNKVCSAPVLSRMCVENLFSQSKVVSFNQLGPNCVLYATIHGIFPENLLFLTKEELFNSLF